MNNNINLIIKYFNNLTLKQKEQLEELKPLYEYWNERINVISRKDMDFLYERHVLHSLSIAKIISFSKGTRIMDIGCGGGFPGIPLAIMFPDVEFYLVDSIGKKIKVVNEVSTAIGLKNVIAKQVRAEETKEKVHFVVTRAVAELSILHKWAHNKIASDNFNSLPNGIIALKGGNLDEELKPFPKIKVYHLNDFFAEEFFETKKIIYLS